jgi:hypothetical protein
MNKDRKDTMMASDIDDSFKKSISEPSKNIHKRKHRHVYNIQDNFFYFALLSAPILGLQFMAPIFEANLLIPAFEVCVAVTCIVLALMLLYMMWWPKPGTVRAVRASTFNPEKVPKNLDTIVIGSGSGGATCANLLAQSGQRVLVLEQHPTATGGCTHSFREQNCEWDTGL